MEKNKQMTKLSQDLRRKATKEENTLWYQYLRNYPIQFRRQCPLGGYIVDFYCAKALLVVELDGSQHFTPENMERDAVRSQYLESLGIKVLRFSNTDVNKNFKAVCEAINFEVKPRYGEEPVPQGMGRSAFSTWKR